MLLQELKQVKEIWHGECSRENLCPKGSRATPIVRRIKALSPSDKGSLRFTSIQRRTVGRASAQKEFVSLKKKKLHNSPMKEKEPF